MLLEIGAGYGIFCQEATKTGAFSRVIGVEPTPGLAKVCRDKGIDIIESSYESLDPNLRADVVACYEVIEHLQSPQKFMEWVLRTLTPGGFLVMTCPCISGFETTVQGRHSGTIDHQHVNLFSAASLPLLAQRIGFVDVELETPGQLDAELVKQAIAKGKYNREALGEFLEQVLVDATPEVLASFQAFLRAAGRSSHMRLVAHKPR